MNRTITPNEHTLGVDTGQRYSRLNITYEARLQSASRKDSSTADGRRPHRYDPFKQRHGHQ